MNKYSQAAMQLAVRVGKFLRRKSPEIMTGIGVVGIGATIYTTVKAVPKIQEIKEEAKATLDDIDAAEASNFPNYSAEDAAKDRKIVRVQTAVKLVKAVAPVVASVGVTLSGFLGAHKILSERNATLSALTMATDKAFREYRKKVAETFGEEAEHDLRYGLTEEEIEVKAIGEDGKENVVKERRKVQNRAGYFGQFDFIFDENVPGWERDARANKTYVLQIQDWANKEAERKFYLYHNGLSVADICERFAIKKPKGSRNAGWMYDPNDPKWKSGHYIDFGVFNIHDEDARAFANGLERSFHVVLDPDTLNLEELERLDRYECR